MRYNEDQKADALKLADEIGAKKASKQLSIAYPTILEWRKKRSDALATVEEVPSAPLEVSDAENLSLEMKVQLLQQENAQLKIQLARQAKAIHALSPVAE
jgi:transposase-like protein